MKDVNIVNSVSLCNKDQDTNKNKALYFIEIQKSEMRKIKIPCSNEAIAKKILQTYSNNNSDCKVSFM